MDRKLNSNPGQGQGQGQGEGIVPFVNSHSSDGYRIVWRRGRQVLWKMRQFALPNEAWSLPGGEFYLGRDLDKTGIKAGDSLMAFGGYHSGMTALVSWLIEGTSGGIGVSLHDLSSNDSHKLVDLEADLEKNESGRLLVIKSIDSLEPGPLEGLAAKLVAFIEEPRVKQLGALLITSHTILPFDPLRGNRIFSSLLSRSTLLRPTRFNADEIALLVQKQHPASKSYAEKLVEVTGGEPFLVQATIRELLTRPGIPTTRELLRLELPTYRVWRRSLADLMKNPVLRIDISRLLSRGRLGVGDTLDNFDFTELSLTGWIEREDDCWVWCSELRQNLARQVWQAASTAGE